MFLSDTSSLILNHLLPLLEKQGDSFRAVSGVDGGAVAWLAALLGQKNPAPLVLVVSDNSRVESLYRELLFFTTHLDRSLPLLQFPAWETLPYERLSPFGVLVGERLTTLFRMAQMHGDGPVLAGDDAGNRRAVIITTPAALMQRLMPRQVLVKHGFSLAVGDQLNLAAFRGFLVEAGYRVAAQVQEPGEFAVRGGIVDLFPSGRDDPIRIELFGDEVETMRLFDVVTQRSTDAIRSFKALPVCEAVLNETTIAAFRTGYRSHFGGGAADDDIYKSISQGQKVQGMEQYLPLFYDRVESFFDYLPTDALFLLEPSVMGAATQRETEILEQFQLASGGQLKNRRLPWEALFMGQQELRQKMAVYPVLELQPERAPQQAEVRLEFTLPPVFHAPDAAISQDATAEKRHQQSVFGAFSQFLLEKSAAGYRICLATRTQGQRERLRELMGDHGVHVLTANSWGEAMTAPAGSVQLAVGDVRRGFVHEDQRLILLSEEEIFGPRVRRRKPDRHYLNMLIASFADLNEGNLVVHSDHGIGRYGGLLSLEVKPVKNDYLLITYAGDDKLYVPVENLDRVSKYSGGDEVPLDKLGGTHWEKAKTRAERKIMEMAEELVALQARRAATEGFAFAPADPLYHEFAATFPYEETPDQSQAIQAVLEDMASHRPMDRLVCGDVGFGKTEVALRAAFRAAMDNKQVAVLVPTTILAQQHFETFSKRLAPYPIRVDLLSRFRSPQQQKKTVAAVADGYVDVVIGTHRLLQDDIHFKDLGLLVVDEEQRFGVTHKEKIKQFRATVDILTLTATPIPRTMHMAMAGVREISIIASPPADRLSIRTIVTQHDPQQLREAILREIHRGGQVFYVYNYVEDIERVAASITELVPEAKVGVAHGQMRETHLERIMLSFYHQEFNVLVCTTIIENGVDIPSANTIIIHRADRFGLAQLHQLRGRVGRAKHRGYAYLLIPSQQSLADDARKRLEAIETLADLGAGFMLATHDLEIRGAGNILGDEQSGQIREVGFELYNDMLAKAIKELNVDGTQPRKGSKEEEVVPTINLHISTFIPSDYVPDVQLRLSLYKRIADLDSVEEISDMRVELIDRFGMLPEPVDNLLSVLLIKKECRALKILKLEAGPMGGSFQFHPKPRINAERLLDMIRKGSGTVRLDPHTYTLSLRNRPWENTARRLQEVNAFLAEMRPKESVTNPDQP